MMPEQLNQTAKTRKPGSGGARTSLTKKIGAPKIIEDGVKYPMKISQAAIDIVQQQPHGKKNKFISDAILEKAKREEKNTDKRSKQPLI